MNRSPLFLAVINNHKKMVELLIKHKANVNIIDTEKNTVAHLASINGFCDIL